MRAVRQRDEAGPLLQIGEVSDQTGLTQRTLRYYESVGLLPPPTRMEGGFRLYTEEDVRRLERIVELKRLLGFSLAEIRETIEAEDMLQQLREEGRQLTDPAERRDRLQRAMAIIQSQLHLISARMEAMQQLRDRYERRLARFQERLERLEQVRA